MVIVRHQRVANVFHFDMRHKLKQTGLNLLRSHLIFLSKSCQSKSETPLVIPSGILDVTFVDNRLLSCHEVRADLKFRLTTAGKQDYRYMSLFGHSFDHLFQYIVEMFHSHAPRLQSSLMANSMSGCLHVHGSANTFEECRLKYSIVQFCSTTCSSFQVTF